MGRGAAGMSGLTRWCGVIPCCRCGAILQPRNPFLALMEDWFPRGVFGKHPHRGIETVTYVIEGRIDHYDNLGHEGTIEPGDVQHG